MRFQIVLLYLAKFSFAFSQESVKIAVSYFRERNVKTVCLLSDSNHIGIQLAKEANKDSITVLQYINNDTTQSSCQRQVYTHTGIVLNTDYPTFQDVLVNASKKNIFDSNHIWLIFDENNSTEINTIFSILNLSVNVDVTIAQRMDSGYTLYDIFNFGRIQGGNLQKEITGHWSQETGLILKKGFKYTRRFDFQRLALRLMIVYQGKPEEFRPEIILEREVAPGISMVTQTSGMILNELASIHNINFNYSICDRWVGDYKRESPNAVTNSLYFKEIDVTPTLRFLPSHLDYYDVIHQYVTYAEGKYFYRIPTTGVGKFENQFLTPFTRDVWFTVIGVITLCGIGLLLSAKLENRPKSGHYAFFSVVALSCQQFFEDIDDGVVTVL
ncbi:unnamed protein product [Pieris macdunnoughi]|uniref:Ionotropic receptor 75a N-terminal domain-containing protein n=1 Tax=Pieris macdunnoughi TaxID=345717 RepID=A0A821Y6J3_9NEOP|nr:unnamed protein product [Pieris macdunnoughi]